MKLIKYIFQTIVSTAIEKLLLVEFGIQAFGQFHLERLIFA